MEEAEAVLIPPDLHIEKRRLRKNRSRVIYIVQGDEPIFIHALKYTLKSAVRLAKKHHAWIYQGKQNARWITEENLLGRKMYKTRVYKV